MSDDCLLRVQSYKSAAYFTGAYPGTGATLPVWSLETSYSASSLTVYDYHGKSATCSATVAIWVRCPMSRAIVSTPHVEERPEKAALCCQKRWHPRQIQRDPSCTPMIAAAVKTASGGALLPY